MEDLDVELQLLAEARVERDKLKRQAAAKRLAADDAEIEARRAEDAVEMLERISSHKT